MNMMTRYRTRIWQGIGISLGILILLLIASDLPALWDSLQSFNTLYLVPIFLLKLLNYSFRYAEWHYLLGVVGVKVGRVPNAPAPDEDIPAYLNLWDSIAIFLAGFAMQISPGKVAEVLKSAIVKHLTEVPIAKTAPVVLTERIVDGFAVLIIIGAAVAFQGDAIFGNIGDDIEPSTLQAVVFGTWAVMVLGIIVLQIRVLALGILDIVSQVPLIKRLVPWLRTFYLSSYKVLQLKRLIPTIGFGLVAYGSDCIALLLMLQGFGATTTTETLAQGSFILGFAVIVAALSAMPGGAGARELSVGGLLVAMVGLDQSTATATVVINTFFQVGLGVLIGLGVMAIFRQRLFSPNLQIEDDQHAPNAV